jgi:PAS domain S-box-containing protein
VDDVVWSAHWTPPDFSQCHDLNSMIQVALDGWHFEYISHSVERMFGFTVEECISDLPEYRKVPESFPATAQMVMEKLAAHDPKEPFRHTFETSFFAKDGSQLWCEITVTFLPVEPGQPLWLLGILRNITRRHETQEALKKSEAQVRGLFENIPDIVALLDRNSVVRYVNHGTQAVPAEKLMGESIFSFVEPPYQQVCRQAFEKALSGSEAQPVEAQVITGKYWSCRVVPMIADRDNNPVMLICTDITAEKKAALAILQEQQLLRQLIDLQERERRFLSYEIHDGFAQQITGALFHVEAFKRLREEDLLQAERNLNQAMKMLSRSIDETRRLISGLRPPILDEAGIIAAVEYLICENRARSNIDVMFVHNLEAIRLAPPLESAVFRIIQESLTNAARHSQSDFIRVELNGSDDLLEIVVFDEGVGFEPASVPEDRFGLRGIRERARLLGGNVEIEASPGDGCRIRVELPLIPAAEN